MEEERETDDADSNGGCGRPDPVGMRGSGLDPVATTEVATSRAIGLILMLGDTLLECLVTSQRLKRDLQATPSVIRASAQKSCSGRTSPWPQITSG